MDLEEAKWITAPADMGQAGPLFTKEFFCETGAAKALMHVSAVGLYKLFVNGTAYSFGLFNPGFTSYQHRIQYQTYDVTESIRPGKNRLEILAAGIRPCFDAPGYEKVLWKPAADPRMGALSYSLETKYGTVQSAWKVLSDGKTAYEISLPEGVTAEVKLPGISETKTAGKHRYIL